jgi:hypothetical protein
MRTSERLQRSVLWLFEPEVFGEKVTGQEAIGRKKFDIRSWTPAFF